MRPSSKSAVDYLMVLPKHVSLIGLGELQMQRLRIFFQRPISWGKSLEENSTWQNFSEPKLKLFPMFYNLIGNSSQAEKKITLNFVSWNWPLVKTPKQLEAEVFFRLSGYYE